MQQESISNEIKKELNHLDFDIKAEAFFVNFLKDYNFHFFFKDYFERGYGKDVKNIELNTDSYENTHHAYLTRLGFYDIFPENFFHTQNNTIHVTEMVKQYKDRKEEEKYARNFFQPVENELFQYLIATEEQEKNIISNLSESEFLNLLSEIWSIDKRLPSKTMAKIFKFIPFVHKISGDIKAITYILEHIFNEKITLEETFLHIENTNSNNNEMRLGENFALKNSNITFLKKYIFTIKNIKNLNNISDYFENGKIYKMISLFLEYTLPFESDFNIKFTINSRKQAFVLNSDSHTGRMNISTRLT